MTAALHSEGLAGTSHLHGYHCDCDDCMFGPDAPAFRGQTDSSCSGEVISNILAWDHGLHYGLAMPVQPTDLFAALERIAVDVDAEPGPSAGLHVHVSVDGMSTQEKADAVTAWVAWEATIADRLAIGRWSEMRGMNTRVYDYFCNWRRYYNPDLTVATMDENDRVAFYHHCIDSDRHSHLNVRQRNHATFEFRVWNSTRSAWRVELAVRASQALLHPDNVAYALNPTRGRWDYRGALTQLGTVDDRLAELIARQRAYIDRYNGGLSGPLAA